MTIKKVNVNKMNPAPYNPREQLQPGEKDYNNLKKSIEKYGFVQPIVWNERTGNIVGGHQRYYIGMDLGFKSIPTKVVDLDETEEKQLNLALNKIGGRWDETKLSELLSDLKGYDDIDMDLTGFDAMEIDKLTLAFSDTDLDIDFNVDMEEEEITEQAEEMDEPLEDMEDEPTESKLDYTLHFEHEQEKMLWIEFLRKLKQEFDNDAFPTHSSRVYAFLKKGVFHDA